MSDHGFTGSYDSVKRFVRRLGNTRALPMRRIETAAGEEAQVDFGTGAPVIGPDGKRRKTQVFPHGASQHADRIVLLAARAIQRSMVLAV